MQDQSSPAAGSSSERSSSSGAPQTTTTEDAAKEGMESDDETAGRVPEFGLALPVQEAPTSSTSGRGVQAPGPGTSSSRRGRSPADKEHRRLKRLLRNRVSAQQARERKKAYMSELEVRVKELERTNSELEEKLSTLHNENHMLRQVLKNTTVNRRGPADSSAGGDDC
ncbi:hypothetical protein GUJ93_ZPchr0006g45046 [Zizania palustris]|uniref:Transcription factor HY5 n=1 Tax=Zizania palustris TaxID=103762 RepID=A0A8J5VKX7_ZIZPA|nr:hypothetical protein GUJ93_ZPchr0006g45046 [Zizania palustris]